MQRSIISDQVHENVECAFRKIHEEGYEWVELHNVFEKSIEQCDMEEVEEIARLLEKYRLKVCSIASTIFFLCPLYKGDEVSLFNDSFYSIAGNVEEHLEYARKACRIAKRLNAPYIRVFPFRVPDNRKGPYGTKNDFERIEENMKRLVEIAKEEDMVFVVENCPYSHLPKGEMTLKLVQMINDAHLRLLWDPGNSYRAEKDQVPEEYLSWSLPEEARHLASYIGHIHIKDYHYDSRFEKPFIHRPIGKGDIDFHLIFNELEGSGYSNVLSLEPEVDREEAIECMNTLKRMV
ncbi:hypothetical protein C815_02256 [Firmicutes bacterium M10-2]|nr:hypothetical protein C815_02256 [Firmicutes bacterium M10-2]